MEKIGTFASDFINHPKPVEKMMNGAVSIEYMRQSAVHRWLLYYRHQHHD